MATRTAEALKENLTRFRYHALFVVFLIVSVVGLVRVAPSFMTVLNFFSPLLVSTALFLVAVVFINRSYSPPAAESGDTSAASASSSSSVGGGFDGKEYFGNLEGERGLLESAAEQQEGGRLMFDSMLK
ncbi:uncharacterized protein LOC116259148 [Nymphaea colorata]|nr:uncharacterized protein LOC116259148 [Nymphaea colorata]